MNIEYLKHFKIRQSLLGKRNQSNMWHNRKSLEIMSRALLSPIFSLKKYLKILLIWDGYD